MAKNQIQKTMWWIIGPMAIIGVVYGLIIWSRQPGGQEWPGQAHPILGVQHISVGASHPAYNSNPPTSGWHYAQPANWGVYQTELPDEQVVHNLEHGGVWISYKEIDDATKVALEKIGRANSQIIVTPRRANDAHIALASWGRLQKLEQFDETAIMNFIKANKNRSPEPFGP
ncbi:MAG: DUF3105 domain-containing protein [Patescibacteria group bacterium]